MKINNLFNSMHDYYNVLPIFTATLFFVGTQAFLKNSFSKDDDFLTTTTFFALGFSLIAILNFLYFYNQKSLNYKKEKVLYPLVAGILFFFGNLLWVFSISKKTPLSIIRVVMSGFETFLLILVGYVLFSTTLHWKQIVGILLVFFGIYIIGNGNAK